MLKNKLTEYDKIEHSDGLIIWYQKHSEEIVGIVSLRPHNGQTWICSLYVSPDFRGLGICRDILDYATFNGGNHLSVRKTNTRAVDIYKNTVLPLTMMMMIAGTCQLLIILEFMMTEYVYHSPECFEAALRELSVFHPEDMIQR